MWEVSTMELMLDQLLALFKVLVGLILVTVVVLITYVLLAARRTRGRARRQRAEAEQDKAPGAAWSTAPRTAGQVVTLLRREPGSALQVEVGGTHYRRLAEIEDPQLKRQVVEAALDLVRFTGVLGVEPIAPAPVDKTYSWREDLRQNIRAHDQPAAPRTPNEDLEAQFLNLLSELGPAPAVEKRSLASAIQQRLSPKGTQQEQPHTVVDDIEAIVQRRVVLIPALAGRDLHVRPGEDGSVHFFFEGQDYEQLDDIPNLTARQLVKDAIQEWDETM
jgi:hypothetical protein